MFPYLTCCMQHVRANHYLLQLVLKNFENPPIMKPSSWTRAAPFKEERHHRTPSESIANNFTPTANNLKLRSLRKRPSPCKNQFTRNSVSLNYWAIPILPQNCPASGCFEHYREIPSSWFLPWGRCKVMLILWFIDNSGLQIASLITGLASFPGSPFDFRARLGTRLGALA